MSPIFSVEKGKGQSVILIHGFCETHEIWQEISDSLAAHYKVFCIDLPGFGKSPLPATPFSISDISQLVLNWIKDEDIGRPVIIGHSLGGYVALEMARQKPECAAGLGLFHSTAQADSPEKKENRNKVVDFVSRNGAKPFLDSFVPSLFYKKYHPSVNKIREICNGTSKESIVNYALAMRDRIDYQFVMDEFTEPILFICGDNDNFIPVEVSKKQAEKCTDSHFYVLNETGHMGMIEKPENAAKAIKRFLQICF